MPFDLDETDRLLSTTRAVRRRLDLERPVPPQLILDCIRLSQQAPTGSNQQGWRWLVVTDAAKRARLADLYREAGGQYLAQAAGQATVPQTRRVLESAVTLAERLQDVPVHVIPCQKGKLPDSTPPAMQAGYWGSIFPAVWSFQLALRARGLGSVLTTLHLGRADQAAELLGIPDDVTQCALLPVAWTKGDDFRPAKRRPPEHITHWDRWDGPAPG